MRILITGGTGTIGRRLARTLLDRGDEVVVLSRSAKRAAGQPQLRGAEFVEGDPSQAGAWFDAVDGTDAVVNLVGASLFAERWNDRVKQEIRASRVDATAHVVAAIAKASKKPGCLIQGSAVGFYGDRGDDILTEESTSGTDWLSELCVEWEKASAPVDSLGVRRVVLRTGVVLERGSGALAALEPVFKWVPGGAAPVGSGGGLLGRGKQWMAWIHIEDLVRMIVWALDREEQRGPLNGVGPNPERNVEFSRELAKVLRRPFLPFGPPDFVLRLAIGEVATAVTGGQRALPRHALDGGFVFRHPSLAEALRSIYG